MALWVQYVPPTQEDLSFDIHHPHNLDAKASFSKAECPYRKMGGWRQVNWKLTGLLVLHMLWQARDPVSNQEEDRYTLTSITVACVHH